MELDINSRQLGVGHSISDLSAFLEEKAFVYLLRCNDNSLYCGWSSDLSKRLKVHNTGKGAKYTKTRLPVKLVYFEVYEDKIIAMKREYEIKQLTKLQKERLINGIEDIVCNLSGITATHPCMWVYYTIQSLYRRDAY